MVNESLPGRAKGPGIGVARLLLVTAAVLMFTVAYLFASGGSAVVDPFQGEDWSCASLLSPLAPLVSLLLSLAGGFLVWLAVIPAPKRDENDAEGA